MTRRNNDAIVIKGSRHFECRAWSQAPRVLLKPFVNAAIRYADIDHAALHPPNYSNYVVGQASA
jgi:hypothetical protein